MSSFRKDLKRFYSTIHQNIWYGYFYIFCRLSLSVAFLIAGIIKITGERFASGLDSQHPMGAFLEATYDTGVYYNFLGFAQVLAALLLLFKRTVALGAAFYLPIILNITVLTFSVRFEGAMVSAPLLLFANIFIIIYNLDKFVHLLPFEKAHKIVKIHELNHHEAGFPTLFAAVVALIIAHTVAFAAFGFKTLPKNSIEDCKLQFDGKLTRDKGCEFCDCIYVDGNTLKHCLEEYNDR